MSSRRLSARDYKRPHRGALGIDATRARPFGVGLALGLSVAAIVFIADHRPHPSTAEPLRPVPHRDAPDDLGLSRSAGVDEGADPQAQSAAAAAGAVPRGNGASGHGNAASIARYDFYQMLPKSQVIVPGREHGSRPAPTAQVDRPGTYFLQVGSYRDAAVAEHIRAQVARLGIDATVQRIAVDSDIWHRVRVGPIRDLALLNRLRHQLQAGRLDSLVVRVDD